MSWNIWLPPLYTSVPGHAPRERVSWNCNIRRLYLREFVTLHVSVWVEMSRAYRRWISSKSRSTWACELKWYRLRLSRNLYQVTLHVSVWVEMAMTHLHMLKPWVTLHVSVWVEIQTRQDINREIRVTLHVSVWVEISKIDLSKIDFESRSTWACELKSSRYLWGSVWRFVTLHVSVWVEIAVLITTRTGSRSRSTWACELKCCLHGAISWHNASRSTWACELK